MSQKPEDYRKSPIYGTDFSKELSVIIETIRNQMTQTRGHITDIGYGYPGWKERVEHVGGLLTCGIIALAYARDEIAKFEIARDDKDVGPSHMFRVRGIGLDMCPCCFVCGTTERSPGANSYLNNISAFTDSKEAGEQIVAWFEKGARLDFRPSEPNWIQVKIGGCDAHVDSLRDLEKLVSVHDRIRQAHIAAARSFQGTAVIS